MGIISVICDTVMTIKTAIAAVAISTIAIVHPTPAKASYFPPTPCTSTLTTNCTVTTDSSGALPNSIVSGVTMQGSQISGSIPTATLPATNLTGTLPNSLGGLQSLYHQTVIDVATNPTTPTSIISNGYCNGAACSAIVIKANTCRPGMSLAVVGGGTYATGGVTAPTFTGTVKMGSVTLGTGSAGALLAGGPNGFNYNFRVVFATCGASAQVYMTGNLGFAASGGLTGGLYLNTGTTYKTVDMTVDETLDILGSYSTDNAANNFKNIIVDAILEP